MANNNWNNYTEKTATPVDADEVMVRDSADGKNKKLLFGTFWKWVAKKLNEATISELQTRNKTIVGALNQLNSDSLSKSLKTYKGTDYTSRFCQIVVSKNSGVHNPSCVLVFGYEGIGIALFEEMKAGASPIDIVNIHGSILSKTEDQKALIDFIDGNRQVTIISPSFVEIELKST